MISVAGGISNWTAYNFDGVRTMMLQQPEPPLTLRMRSGIKVESTALPAQYGVHASANVNVVTKSGTTTPRAMH